MPLPDAEPTPNKANVYEQYSHLTVKEFSQDNYDVTKLPLNLNADSEDVLRRLELIGQVTSQLSSSGAIPGTIQYFPVNGVILGQEYGELWILSQHIQVAPELLHLEHIITMELRH